MRMLLSKRVLFKLFYKVTNLRKFSTQLSLACRDPLLMLFWCPHRRRVLSRRPSIRWNSFGLMLATISYIRTGGSDHGLLWFLLLVSMILHHSKLSSTKNFQHLIFLAIPTLQDRLISDWSMSSRVTIFPLMKKKLALQAKQCPTLSSHLLLIQVSSPLQRLSVLSGSMVPQ